VEEREEGRTHVITPWEERALTRPLHEEGDATTTTTTRFERRVGVPERRFSASVEERERADADTRRRRHEDASTRRAARKERRRAVGYYCLRWLL
jgi:hypothetical protein